MNDASSPALVTYADVAAAAARLEGVAHRTPVATSTQFDALTGAQAFFKCENLQRSVPKSASVAWSHSPRATTRRR